MSSARKPALRQIYNQPSYVIRTKQVEVAVAELGGCMAPVTFHRDSRRPLQPLAVAPWWNERPVSGVPQVLNVLRGDFFCMPFGGAATAYRGRDYPPHGEPANSRWRFADRRISKAGSALELRLPLKLQAGEVRKTLALAAGENVIYSRHRLCGLSGSITYSHHATLKFPDRPGSGRLSFSRLVHAATCHTAQERPEDGSYSILKPGCVIDDLTKTPLIDGTTTDLTSYPNRRGFEDVAMVCADTSLEFSWSAATLERERYVWFNLKNPRVLASTVLWFSNGGRHFVPWNGRHINVLGMEEATTFWGDGIAASEKPNDFSRRGIQTHKRLRRDETFDVPCIMGVAKLPRGFRVVRDIRRLDDETIRITGNNRLKVDVKARLGFLETAVLEGLVD